MGGVASTLSDCRVCMLSSPWTHRSYVFLSGVSEPELEEGSTPVVGDMEASRRMEYDKVGE